MKFFLALVALVGFASAYTSGVRNPFSGTDEEIAEQSCRLFVQCCQTAMKKGVPAIPVPNHDPLKIRDLAFNASNIFAGYAVNISDFILYNLVDFTVVQLDATLYTKPERVNYDYSVYWPKLNFTGKFEAETSIGFIDIHQQGTFNIVLRDVFWSGLFNLTKPGQEAQNIPTHVDDFTLHSKTDSVEVSVKGVNKILEVTVETAVKLALKTLMNNFPAKAGQFLKDQRFNGFWLANPDKLNTLIQFCVESGLNDAKNMMM